MTTKNRIITEVLDSVVYLPIECVHSSDSITYVYKDGHKQQVITGKSNDNDIVILAGVQKGEKVYLVPPQGAENWSLKKLPEELINKFKAHTEKKKPPVNTSNRERKKRGTHSKKYRPQH
jgi:hypothetical protein